MAKNKAQLQSDADQYRAAVASMRTVHREGRFSDALKIAIQANEFVDGMMQFERRFEERSERKIVETIAYIFQYAPLVFDRVSLETIGGILKSQKRIDKNTTADLSDDLKNAFELMWDAHRLWSLLEQVTDTAQDKLRTTLGGDQDRWRGIAETWERMGIIHRLSERGSYRISLATRITAEVRGKCAGCGATGKAAMGRFLEEIACPKCKTKTMFVMLSAAVPSAS